MELGERVAAVRAAIAEAGVELEVRSGGEVGHEMVEGMGQHELEGGGAGATGGALDPARDALRRHRRGLPRGEP